MAKKPHKNIPPCQISVGTSGYSYNEWTEAGFYPAGTKSGHMLSNYAEHFSITELNYTWYQMPKAEAVERQRRSVPPEFLFAVKLTRTLTHEIDPELWQDHAISFRDGVAPLMQSGQLAAVLIQLPPMFRRTPPNRKHLAALLDALFGLPLAVEFRHDSWATDRVFTELESRKVTLVAVDEPDLPGLFPALDVVTNPDLFYVRFHGKNAKSWRSGNMQLQFDYNYSDQEMQTWIREKIGPMSTKARKGVIFFNNHVRAQAPNNAKGMIQLLADHGLAVI
ncbi:MAG: DUF72 domain-containing protein [Deltaproteobacteria bacterium]|nr:DUF72 domain-containing protein [Deltaproteobacteria bacterium]